MERRLAPDAQSQANVLERKLAIALATTAGGIDWLWNVNSYITLDQEVTVRAGARLMVPTNPKLPCSAQWPILPARIEMPSASLKCRRFAILTSQLIFKVNQIAIAAKESDTYTQLSVPCLIS